LSLCLNKHHAIKAYWGMEVELHAFLTSAVGEYHNFDTKFSIKERETEIRLESGVKHFQVYKIPSFKLPCSESKMGTLKC